MIIDDAKKSRAVLKSYFVKNAIPTEQQFAQLMDSVLNQRDDGLVKVAGDPLSIEAAGDDTSFKKALNFYTRLSDNDPAWTVSLRPRSNRTDPKTGRAGLSINDAAGNSRLAINAATGRVGIGTVEPAEALEVAGRIRVGPLTIGAPDVNTDYSYVGASALPDLSTTYALAVGTSGTQIGRTALNGTDVRLRINTVDRLTVTSNGNVGIGTTTPSELLEVAGSIRAGVLSIGSWPAGDTPNRYGFFGASTLNHADQINYALIQSAAGNDKGATYLNSPESIHFRIANKEKVSLDHDGNFTVGGVIHGRFGDFAEVFFSHDPLVAGDVVSLDPDADLIAPASEANCSRVIGVVSTQPGMVLKSQIGREDIPSDGSAGFPVALSGCVPCKVTDEGGPIRRGDLLTAASRPGYAMRAAPIGAEGVYRAGTIIGKALGPHGAGDGMIEIFVMLH